MRTDDTDKTRRQTTLRCHQLPAVTGKFNDDFFRGDVFRQIEVVQVKLTGKSGHRLVEVIGS